MKKFLMIAAAVFFMAAPAMAMDEMEHADGAAMEAAADVSVDAEAPAVEAQVDVDAAAAAKEECTAETNEKVKLPENAGDAEKAQWDAAFAECVKSKGVDAEAEAGADAAVEEAPAEETTSEEEPAAE